MENNTVALDQLTPEEQEQLMAQLVAKQKSREERRKQEIESYKKLQDGLLDTLVPILLEFHEKQAGIVDRVFAEFSTLIGLKRGLYDVEAEQDSHTFSRRNGSSSIRIGRNVIIGFDGTESAGIEKIKKYIAQLAGNDAQRQTLTDLLNTFMKPNSKGELNPTRIKELSDHQNKINDPLFKEGIEIILNAQTRTYTSQYVRGFAMVKDGEKSRKVTFNISVDKATS